MPERTIIHNGDTWEFLDGLSGYVDRSLPSKLDLVAQVSNIVEVSKSSGNQRQNNYPEGAFLHSYLIPCIYKYVRQFFDTDEQTRHVFLAEGDKHHPCEVFGTPASPVSYPFDKVIGTQAADLLTKWTGVKSTLRLARACPDLALRGPHKVVFEVKYFRDHSGSAASALVEGIYQTAFYRGLPSVHPQRGPDWDYPFACLVAYDATQGEKLSSLWNSIPTDVRDAFWNSSNLFVAILPKTIEDSK